MRGFKFKSHKLAVMDLEKDYIEYVVVFSLATLACSAAYFWNPFQPLSYATLLLIPVLFGYTSYISRNGFRYAALLSLIAVMFTPLSLLMAAIAVIVGLGNVLVGVFSGGDDFKEFYSSTTIPLLLTGIVLGAGLFLVATNSQDVSQEIRVTVSEVAAENVANVVENAGIVESQKQAQVQVIEQASRSTVRGTELHILNNTDITGQDRTELLNAFDSASQEIPEQTSSSIQQQMENQSIDVESRAESIVEQNLKGNAFLLLVPLVAMGIYSLQPLVGLLTAIAAYLFLRQGRS